MQGDPEFPFDVVRIDAGSPARYPRDHRRRRQVHEHVPRLAQHHRLVARHTVGPGDCDRGVDRTHVAILERGQEEMASMICRQWVMSSQ